MSYFAKLIKTFIPGKSIIRAHELNEIVNRLKRLENFTSNGPLTITDTENGVAIALTQKIIDIDFAVLNEELYSDKDKFYSARLLTQIDTTQYVASPDNLFEFTKMSSEGYNINCRNLFGFCADIDSYICVVKFKRGRGEWIIIQATCPSPTICDDPSPAGPFTYTP